MAGRNKVIKDGDKVVGFVHSDYFDGYEPDQLFNLDSFRLTEDLIKTVLKEAKNNNFYVTVRTNAIGTDYTFKKVKGTKLDGEYFAYKSDVSTLGYSITDIASGLAIVNGLSTVKACKEYLANLTDEQKAKINEIKQQPKYQEVCKKLVDFIINDNGLNQDFPDPED